LTSKSWNASKLVNKFYILITNSLMSVKEKLMRNDHFTETQVLHITNFHHFCRILSNFINFTLMLENEGHETDKEEDIIAEMLAYELS
jgi:hypothetical protein